jgi:Protein of unknown function (DUF2911)
MTLLTRTIIASVLILGGSARGAHAQGIPFSQRAEVAQRVAFTDITITYNRPTARGRVIYGDSGIVKWGQLWHPGADSATRIAFSTPVTFEGRPLAAGTYSLWTIPRESAAWTVILNSRARVFHSPYVGAATEVLRVDVVPVRGPHMESLAYYFPAVARDSTVLRLHWGETIVPMRVRVATEPPR